MAEEAEAEAMRILGEMVWNDNDMIEKCNANENDDNDDHSAGTNSDGDAEIENVLQGLINDLKNLPASRIESRNTVYLHESGIAASKDASIELNRFQVEKWDESLIPFAETKDEKS